MQHKVVVRGYIRHQLNVPLLKNFRAGDAAMLWLTRLPRALVRAASANYDVSNRVARAFAESRQQ